MTTTATPTPTPTLTVGHLSTLATYGQDTGAFRVNNGGAKALAEAINAVLAELAEAQAKLASLEKASHD